jgi:DNA-binding HxlR family transcriptional regulator
MDPRPAHAAPSPSPPDSVPLDALQAAVGTVTAKWSLAILASLATGTLRFNELLRHIDGVSRRMLSSTLRGLERDGLVLRHVHARVPARVEYELSDAGHDLLTALAPLAGWSVEHRQRMLDARTRYDRMRRTRQQAEELQAARHARGPQMFY